MSKIPLSENRSPWVNEFGKFGVAHFHAGDICVFWSARPAAARPQSRHGPLLAWAARPVLCASPSLFSIEARAGGVAERSKAHAWKVCIRETVSRVRIPPPPPIQNRTANAGRSRFYAAGGGERSEQVALRSHDADFLVRYLDALSQRAQVFPAVSAAVDPDALAGRPGECLDHSGRD